MDVPAQPTEFISIACTVLLLLLSAHRTLDVASVEDYDDGHEDDFHTLEDNQVLASSHLDGVTQAALQSFRLFTSVRLMDEELEFWVKLRSTTWFSRFLLEQYDHDRWLKMFRMSKPAGFALAELLRPVLAKKDTKYWLSIPVVVRVACTLFKLTHGVSLLICSEFFAMGRSSVSMILREVVSAINVHLRYEITWPRGAELLRTESEFEEVSGLPGVVEAIDGTHIAISKLKSGPADYYYFKSGGYTINCQAVVDSRKRFLDLFLGMPGSTNDSRVLRSSTLFTKGQHNTLWDDNVSFHGFTPYLVGDAGYPLLPWLLVPHKHGVNLAVAQSLFNKRLRRARGVVENTVALLKQTFRESSRKTELYITFVPDVITCCALLHNLLLRQSEDEVHSLLNVLQSEGFQDGPVVENNEAADPQDLYGGEREMEVATTKRRDLGILLAINRAVPM